MTVDGRPGRSRATFTQDEYTLTVDTIGSGSVAKAPDQATYHDGDTVELTPTAAAGWTFSGWSGDLSGSDDPATVTVHGDMTITATFDGVACRRRSSSTAPRPALRAPQTQAA